MAKEVLNFEVSRLGSCAIDSPMMGVPYIDEDGHVLYHSNLKDIEAYLKKGAKPPVLETAGPRRKIYFDPSKLKCGIVTCGGLCPGLNDVIHSIVMSLYYHYNVKTVFGFRYGYEGLSPKFGHTPIELTPQSIEDIHHNGGTILGSSRGSQDIKDMVGTLDRMNVRILFAIGGDGTLRGAQAISEEIEKQGLKIAVVGVPKTIDNDISFVDRSFGFETAVAQTRSASYCAHAEAKGARNGIGLVKLMGRESGFIAAYACLANNQINFCLVPEVPFSLDVFLKALKKRLETKSHAVIVVGEGAGQNLLSIKGGKDKSGNVQLGDIGVYLKDEITSYFKKEGMDFSLKYIDPSYTIRSIPADPHDSVFCLRLGHCAVHAGMSGRTNMVVGFWKNEFTHVPIPMAISRPKKINPKGRLWSSVLESTGQPIELA